MPEWVKIDPEKIEWVKKWVECQTYAAAERFLRQHPQLVESDYDDAVDEAFIPIEPTRVLALDHMRTHMAGLSAGPYTSGEEFDLVDGFLNATLPQRLHLLNEYFSQLGSDTLGPIFGPTRVNRERWRQ